jgi:predicted transcriptional regulator
LLIPYRVRTILDMTGEHDTPGALWALIQEWMDAMPYPPSQRRLAGRLKISASALSDWKYGRGFPGPGQLRNLAAEIGVPYERVLDAVLRDRGYRVEQPPSEGRRSG